MGKKKTKQGKLHKEKKENACAAGRPSGWQGLVEKRHSVSTRHTQGATGPMNKEKQRSQVKTYLLADLSFIILLVRPNLWSPNFLSQTHPQYV